MTTVVKLTETCVKLGERFLLKEGEQVVRAVIEQSSYGEHYRLTVLMPVETPEGFDSFVSRERLIVWLCKYSSVAETEQWEQFTTPQLRIEALDRLFALHHKEHYGD